MISNPIPSEHQEQAVVVRWMQSHGINFFAVPNGVYCTARQKHKLKAEGLVRGVADLIIVDPPPNKDNISIVGLEMKRRGIKSPSRVQAEWASKLPGWWLYVVASGAKDAIEKLGRLGYGFVDE